MAACRTNTSPVYVRCFDRVHACVFCGSDGRQVGKMSPIFSCVGVLLARHKDEVSITETAEVVRRTPLTHFGLRKTCSFSTKTGEMHERAGRPERRYNMGRCDDETRTCAASRFVIVPRHLDFSDDYLWANPPPSLSNDQMKRVPTHTILYDTGRPQAARSSGPATRRDTR